MTSLAIPTRFRWRVVRLLVVVVLVATGCSSTVAESVAESVAAESTEPTVGPTAAPIEVSAEPTVEVTVGPTAEATEVTVEPTVEPTAVPIDLPTSEPSPEPAEESNAGPAESEPAAVPPLCQQIEGFGDDAADRWRVVNDGVMGGLSFGNVTISGGALRFEGTINTNGGGFSLVETSTLQGGQSLVDALGEADSLRVRVRSAFGRNYEWIAEDNVQRSSRQIMHFAPLTVSAEGVWEELTISLDDFDSRTFGRPVNNEEPFQPQQVRSIGIILADGLDGAFDIEVDRIDACQA